MNNNINKFKEIIYNLKTIRENLNINEFTKESDELLIIIKNKEYNELLKLFQITKREIIKHLDKIHQQYHYHTLNKVLNENKNTRYKFIYDIYNRLTIEDILDNNIICVSDYSCIEDEYIFYMFYEKLHSLEIIENKKWTLNQKR